jgi:hypothetical protein
MNFLCRDLPVRRRPSSGVSILEALVAFAIASLIVTTVLAVSIQTAQQERQRLEIAVNSELALSIVKAWYIGPNVLQWVIDDLDGFETTIEEGPSRVEVPLGMKGRLAYITVEVTVQNSDREETLVRFFAEKAVSQ